MIEKWSSEEQIVDGLHLPGECGGGGVLYCEDNYRHLHTGEEHTLITGETGCGKSRGFIIQTVLELIRAHESLIVLDAKGEIYKFTSWKVDDSYDMKVLNLRDIANSDGVNPFNLIKYYHDLDDPNGKEISSQLIEELAFAMYLENEKEPYWSDAARSLFMGVVNALLECEAREEELNFASIMSVVSKGAEKRQRSTYLKEFAKLFPNTIAQMQLESYVSLDTPITSSCVASTFHQGIAPFAASEGRRSFFSRSDFKISELSDEKPTIVYIILPEETPIFDRPAGILIGQLIRHYQRLAKNSPGERLKHRLNIILEELGSIGAALPDLDKTMSTCRSSNIRITIVLQNLVQLNTLYGESKASTIFTNCGVKVLFRTSHMDTLTNFSRLCGKRLVDESNRYSEEPLITESSLMALETRQALVMRGGIKYITRFKDFTQLYDFSEFQPPQKPPYREMLQPKCFDVQAYVDEHMEEEKDKKNASGSGEWKNPFAVEKKTRKKKSGIDVKDYKNVIIKDMTKCITVLQYGNHPDRVLRILDTITKYEKTRPDKTGGCPPRVFEFYSKESAVKAGSLIRKNGGEVYIHIMEDES